MQITLLHHSLRVAVLVAVFVAPAAAQERQLFTWAGRVDDDVRVSVHSANINTDVVSGNQAGGARIRRVSPLPHREGTVRVEQLAGRGTVAVVQQPTASNNYVAVVEVRDADTGPDTYRFAAFFTPSQTSGGEIVESTALSPGASLLHWSGVVDKDVLITIRGSRIRYTPVAGATPRPTNATLVVGGLPAQDAQLSIAQHQGRGTVTVTQQPSAGNNYTAIIRVRDPRPGLGNYDFDVIWQ